MEGILESLCGNMTLTKGEMVGITITKDETANLRMKVGTAFLGESCLNGVFKRRLSVR
jgi:hypothetical protein